MGWELCIRDWSSSHYSVSINSLTASIKRKIIFVNEPLIFKNLVLYQTDWDIVGIKLRYKNNRIFQVPLKRINENSNRFWFGSFFASSSRVLFVTPRRLTSGTPRRDAVSAEMIHQRGKSSTGRFDSTLFEAIKRM